jgi:hypothetical protein
VANDPGAEVYGGKRDRFGVDYRHDVVGPVAARKHYLGRIPRTGYAARHSVRHAARAARRSWTRAINQIRDRRSGFRFYTAQESNIGGDTQFESIGDIVRFIPRAAIVGFLAPFPRMWFEAGSYGVTGRLLSGAETLVMYFLYLAIAVCLWRERRRLALWLIFLTAAAGMIALGLVVVNAGALYRIRYVFWIMMIVIAAQGIYLTTRRTNETKS